jgi:hypothetical protein
VHPAMPTLRSIAAATSSSNPYRPPVSSSTPLPPLQPVPPRAPPRPGRPVAPACCRPRLSLSLSNMGLTRTLSSPGRCPRPAPPSPMPGLPSCPPPPCRCPAPAPLPRPPALTPSADAANHDAVNRRSARCDVPPLNKDGQS